MPVVAIAAARGMPVGSRLAVEGTVTALPGRVLRAGVTFLQDGTGGIAVALPDGDRYGRHQAGCHRPGRGQAGRPIRQPGAAGDAAPRMSWCSAVAVCPSPATLTSSGLTEAREGRAGPGHGGHRGHRDRAAAARSPSRSGTTAARRVSSCSAPWVSRATRFTTGARLVATGIVGQRESTSGAGDGYRLWPRDSTDLVIAAATPTSRPGGAATATPDADDPTRQRAARSATDRAHRVGPRGRHRHGPGHHHGAGRPARRRGPPTDHPGRQRCDPAAAARMAPPRPAWAPASGRTGEVGTWYGGLQLAADGRASVLGRTTASPVVLRRAPAAPTSGASSGSPCASRMCPGRARRGARRHPLGAGGSLPIVGVAGSHIPSTALAEGRSATITGIVKRAYPTAVGPAVRARPPRSARISSWVAIRPAPAPAPDVRAPPGRRPERRPGDAPGATDAVRTQPSWIPRWTALTGLAGRHVRVSGALRQVERSLLTIDDGSASALVRLLDDDATFEPPLVAGRGAQRDGRGRRA